MLNENETNMNKSYQDLSDHELIELYNKSISKELQHGYYTSKGFMFTEMFEGVEKTIDELEVFDDDIWLSSFPKSGTTWLSEMVWSICNDLNTPAAKIPLDSRVRFLEYSSLFQFEDAAMDYVNNSIKMVDKMERPRIIKTHLPWPCLPRRIQDFTKRPRIIHVARNPKDVAVSYYHHNKLFRGFVGDADLFYEVFLRSLMRCCPYMDNIHSYWKHRDEPNVLFLKFEDMKNDLPSVILKTAKFLNVAIDDAKMDELLKHLSFKNMKTNQDLNVDRIVKYINNTYLHSEGMGSGFFRQGETGAHKQEMKGSTVDRFNQWMLENMIHGLKL